MVGVFTHISSLLMLLILISFLSVPPITCGRCFHYFIFTLRAGVIRVHELLGVCQILIQIESRRSGLHVALVVWLDLEFVLWFPFFQFQRRYGFLLIDSNILLQFV